MILVHMCTEVFVFVIISKCTPSVPRDIAVQHFTKQFIEKLEPKEKRIEYYAREYPGFGIRVFPSGQKSWIYRFKFKGKSHKQKLGSYPSLTLDDAKGLYLSAKKRLKKEGITPEAFFSLEKLKKYENIQNEKSELIQKRLDTVGKLYTAFRNDEIPRLRKRPEQVDWLVKGKLKLWWDRPVSSIKQLDFENLIHGVAEQGSPVAANRAGGVIGQMFKYAVVIGILDYYPFVRTPRAVKEKPVTRVLDADEIKLVWINIEHCPIHPLISSAIKILLLTGQRRNEITQALKSDFNFEEKTWLIPDKNSKNGLDHIVPLTDTAIGIIKQMIPLSGLSKYLLASPVGDEDKPFSLAAITRAVSRNVIQKPDEKRRLPAVVMDKWTPHDLRRTVATNMRRLKIPVKTVEAVLNHKEQGIIRHYDMYDYLDEKKEALEVWEQYVLQVIK